MKQAVHASVNVPSGAKITIKTKIKVKPHKETSPTKRSPTRR